MGADLYIRTITDAANAKYEPLFHEACEERDLIHREIERWEAAAKSLEPAAFVYGAAIKELDAAKGKIAALKLKAEAAQATVSQYYNKMYPDRGYYRDSYNGTSVLWRMGLSWWTDITGGKQTPETLRDALAKVKSHRCEPLNVAQLKKYGCSVDNGENSLKTWQKYYRNKKRRLVSFLERAIAAAERGEVVDFSL